MEDSSTTQSTGDASADGGSTTSEPTLSLGANPSDQPQDTGAAPAATPADQPAQDAPADPAVDPTAASDALNKAVPDPAPAVTPVSGDDLESIKSSALQELAPLVDELDQNPEDKYRTLMMLIQSSDDQKLIKEAYEAAEKIEDKKAKAEALLNIINEINYFTGKDKPENSGSAES